MMLQRLRELRERVADEIIPAFHKEQKVRWFLEIGEDGRFLGLTETGKKKSELTTVIAPYRGRSGKAAPPYLLIDRPDYVLGVVLGNDSPKAVATRHKTYAALVRACVAECREPALEAFVRFLESGLAAARSSENISSMERLDLIAPRVGDVVLTRLPSVRRFWRELQEEKDRAKSQMVGNCLLCGEFGPISRIHPTEFQVGSERTKLITGNESAFLSYGLRQSEIAPLCFRCAREYGEALSYLLGQKKHSMRIGRTTWLFWTQEAIEFDVGALLSSPDSEQIARLLEAPQRGRVPEIESNRFYAMGISATKQRMVIRSWLDRSVADAQAALARYFDHQAIVNSQGHVSPYGLFALAASLVPKRKNRPKIDDLPPQVIPALAEHALTDRPLPTTILQLALARARADRDSRITRPRAALIKLVLLSRYPGKEEFMVDRELMPEHLHPAYQCGRLLATLDAVQRAAVHAKATMIDRFYGTASSAPASVFGVLMRGSQSHLAKLRKTKPGLHHYFDRQLCEITEHLDGFPRTLTMEEQGLFALGYYHQKHRRRGDDEAAKTSTADEINKEVQA